MSGNRINTTGIELNYVMKLCFHICNAVVKIVRSVSITSTTKRGRKPKTNFSDKQYENSIHESENKQVSQYENRQRKQQEKDEEWKKKREALALPDEIGEEKFTYCCRAIQTCE